eukprot:g35003.t1
MFREATDELVLTCESNIVSSELISSLPFPEEGVTTFHLLQFPFICKGLPDITALRPPPPADHHRTFVWDDVLLDIGVIAGALPNIGDFPECILDISIFSESIGDMVTKFADDTKIGGGVDSKEGYFRVQWDLDQMGQWAEKWQMEFNSDK